MASIIYSIEINAKDNFEGLIIKEALIALAKNITPANLSLLANLSKKPNINDKIPKLTSPAAQMFM